MKKIIFLILLGFIIMLGGCIPFGIAINNTVNTNEVLNETIILNKNYETAIFKINSQQLILPSLKIHLTTNEVNRNTDSNGNEYQAKFRFPLRLIITNDDNQTLYEYNSNLRWDSGTRSFELNEVNSRTGEVVVEIDLDKVTIPAPGKIRISMFLGEDTFYYSKIHSAKLIVYDNVYKHTPAILTGIAIILAGIIICVIGIVLLILQQSNPAKTSPERPAENIVHDNNTLDSSVTSTAMICHLSTFAGLVIPFGGILGPLIVWQIKKDEHPFINRHGIAALNFHISMLIYYFVSFLLAFVVIGFFLLMILTVVDIILTIIASIKASNGEEYRYPFAISFVNTI